MKAVGRSFPFVLFVMLYKVVLDLSTESLDKILQCDNEIY